MAREREESSADPKAKLHVDLDSALRDPDPASRQRTLEQLAWDAIDVDPDLAREAFGALEPDSEASRKLVAHFAMRLADEDPEKAIAWAQDLENPTERTEAFGSIAVVIAAKDPERGAALLMAEMPEGRSRDKAAVLVARRWAQAAPEAAANWITALPDGPARRSGLQAVFAHWLALDTAGVAGWIESHPEKAVQTTAMTELALSLKKEPPDRQAQILSQFRDAEFRRKTENLLAQPPP